MSTTEVRGALSALYPRLWRYCLVVSGRPDRADDLAQAACLRALEKAELYQPGSHVDRWVFRIAHRIWLNELRSEALRRGGGLGTIDVETLIDEKPSPETNFFARQVLSEVMALPEAQRVAVLLVYVEGWSYRDAAGLIDAPIGTVMSRLAAARAKLAAKMQPRRDEVI